MTMSDTSAVSSSSAPPEAPLAKPSLMARALASPGLLPVGTFVAIIAVWEISCHLFSIPSYILPAPSRILGGFDSIDTSRWLAHVWGTLRVALIGYFASIFVAIPIAIALARSPVLSRAVYPILVVVQSTPVVAVAPIIIVALGSGDLPRVVITCLITFFPLVVSTTTGLMATPPELIELSRSLRAPVWREISQIRLPFAIPYIFSALKISVTLAVIGAVVAEFVAADKGLGYFIQFSTSMFKVQQAWAGLVILVLMSLVLFQIVVAVQKIWFPWSLPKEKI
ncbi:ABC transporter permease [uncultured Roseibium sp.]|uniref:ABC transporter permease n=1 Tax=uncultured Roseibium sp. TaxID=1936171 RepID=UPI003216C43A